MNEITHTQNFLILNTNNLSENEIMDLTTTNSCSAYFTSLPKSYSARAADEGWFKEGQTYYVLTETWKEVFEMSEE